MDYKSLMDILPEFPITKELDLDNTYIRIDDIKEKIRWKIPLSRLIKPDDKCIK
jgi:hypothetical protein